MDWDAWMEEPGFPITRTALGLAGMTVAAVPVDAEGLDVAAGVRDAPGRGAGSRDARPAGAARHDDVPPRRLALLAWARRNGAWIIEDDYLSELQLEGRAAPALASLDSGGRVLHIGSFSKTISPTLRLGFLVVPPDHARRFGDLAACLAPAPSRARAVRCRGLPAGRALSAPSTPHEAALCRPTQCPASMLGRGRIGLAKGAGDGGLGRGDPPSRVRIGRGRRIARTAVRLGTVSPFALVHAVRRGSRDCCSA